MNIFNNINGHDPFGALPIEGAKSPEFPNGFQNSPFQNQTEETELEYHTKGIDFDGLVKKLKNSNSFDYKYNEFINPNTIITPTNPLDGTEPIETRLHIPAVVSTDEGKRALKLTGRLNKKEGVIRKSSRKSLFSFKLKVNDTIQYIKKIKYDTIDETAVELIATSYNDYQDLSIEIGVGNNTKVKTKIKTKFNTAFRNVGDHLKGLKWLYENAPRFVLNQRGDEILIQDLKRLLAYDTKGTLSWFKDSSSAIINLLLGFKDLKKAYDHFYNNPDEVIRLYSALEDEKKENFIFLLTSLSHIYWKEPSTDVTFMIGENFEIDNNLFLKDNQKRISLQGLKLEKKIERFGAGDFGTPATVKQTVIYPRKVLQPKTIFHPMELVALQDEATGERELVCALHVKSLVDKAKWEQIVTTIEIVVVVIAIIASVGVLAAPGAGVVVTVIATADIVVGVGDLIHIFKRANLDGTVEEDWFVQNWPKISVTVGAVSLSAILRRGLLKHGPKTLGKLKRVRTAASIAMQKKIITLITEIQIELYFFFKQGVVLVGFEPFSVIGKIIGSNFAKKMEAFGILLTTPAEGSKIRALMFNGQKIAEGTDKELKVVLKEIFPFGGKDIQTIRYLEEIVQESIGLINRTFKTFGNVKYVILEYENILLWKVKNVKVDWINKAEIKKGVLEFDFNTFGIKGIGQKWTEEAFKIFNKRIEKVRAEWTTNPNYPDGESLGFKQFWSHFSESWDEIDALKKTTFYQTMKSNGFDEIDDFFPFKNKDVIEVILKSKL
ncbi:MAG: hypothetical protein AAF489_09560 [Bacteroidota bacterium]